MSFKPKTPYLSADGIIELYKEGIFQGVVLIERLYEPYGLALPGGFVEVGETVEQGLIREMREETNLDVTIKKLLNIYSDPKRDNRFHTATAVYIVSAEGEPIAMDDAKSLAIYSLDKIPFDRLVFDHKEILLDYLDFCKFSSRENILINECK